MTFSDPAFDAMQWDKSHRGDKLNLAGYVETFRDDFDVNSISTPYATSGKWFAPIHAPFGGAKFMSPNGTPNHYIVKNGRLTLRMSLVDGVWQSGMIQSINNRPPEYGFTQTLGYFEMCAKFPRGRGTWPAFWLLSPNAHTPRLEIDIVEAYGGSDWDGHHAAVHLGGVYHDGLYTALATKDFVPLNRRDMFDGNWHTYSALMNEDSLIIYYEGLELGRFPMNDYFRTPVYMLVDLALNLKETPDYTTPKDMIVQYVRAMARH